MTKITAKYRHLLLLLLGLVVIHCGTLKEDMSGGGVAKTEISVPTLGDYSGIGGDFNLIDQEEKPFNLATHRDKIILLFFGYTFCPDFCPLTLSKIAEVYSLLGDSNAKLLTLFISVDPQRDKPELLKEYLEYFSINALGLRGTKEEIDAVIKSYGGQYTYEQKEDDAYIVNHSTYTYLIDHEGKVRFLFRHSDSPEKMVEVIRQLLD